ncbi:hypothetical protein VD0002_g5052 [Verticillium dahliae]|uniref:HTH APSES-type domain-containing protein n=2 Tax=Verticillium dahliae TaxID=27337 RepID=G2XCM6_VERDV|nr:uncharacterized protein VDAG_07908 [Verticillium dahliae VdLs.17]KAF3345508.1 hypothetical protein VdG2_06351 [Verticillium dahliae VDG2]KAH6706887.1 hypothetical protein EV126DRAFT_150210 [Verticillium dahliae]EGY16744.1 hypothetical protein VDAG_07908 [Verticillium dahliae VdLs.17]PNH28309.1 hypothetical protein BJF96_g8399 [Verticillium dahliae]PNH54047.1 hypothetical protein VD0003_g3429 [Verticillium dahliae]
MPAAATAPETITPSTERHLPTKQNPLMVDDIPPYQDLVSRRRLGQTQLTAKMVNQVDGDSTSLGVFDYAHLRAPVPKGIVSGIFKSSPNSYFLMRRSHDGYVSATGMFKATYPYAEAHEEETERRYIKSLPSTSPEETAGNVWIPPDHALSLAEEYGVLPWIQALLDPATIAMTQQPDSPPKKIAAPPKFEVKKAPQPQLAPPTPPRSMRLRRSASPTKSAAPAPRPVKTPRKRKTKSESVDLTAAPVAMKAEINGVIEEDKAAESAAETTTRTVEFEPAVVLQAQDEEQKVKVIVEQDVKIDEEGHETKHTTVALELPLSSTEPPTAEETARMIAEAKSMVEAATVTKTSDAADADGDVDVESEEKEPVELAKSKRKAEDMTAAEEAEEGPESSERSSKRTKPNVQLKKERVRNRALLGISATLAVGAIVPFLMGVF